MKQQNTITMDAKVTVAISEDELRRVIPRMLEEMQPGDWLFEAVKAEAKRRGRWRDGSRGKSFSKGFDPRRQGEKENI